MKKTFIYCCLSFLLCCFTATIAHATSIENTNKGEQTSREILLHAKLKRPQRSLFPNIKAFLANQNLLTISIDQNLDCEIFITISDEDGLEIYSGIYMITEPTEIPIELILDETKGYLLEIQVGDVFYYSGEF